MTAGMSILSVREAADPVRATLRVKADQTSPHAVPRFITGKFCEHLGRNIYGGMWAEVLRNPTFAAWPFMTGTTPDGRGAFEGDGERLEARVREAARHAGLAEDATDRLAEDHADGLAFPWTRLGAREAVTVSPDAGPHGRAQRVEAASAGEGLAQHVHLPLHRVRRFIFHVFARSPDVKGLAVSLATADGAHAATARVDGLSREWRKLEGALELPEGAPPEALWSFRVCAAGAGQIVLARASLMPADHVGGADPDVLRMLKGSHLPILRWPGGNFVSGYHWRDGVGPVDSRPTRPNWAWGGVEPNLFGTDEFVQFCRDVGCEPMICLNAGDGTPEEAARWVEYCNGAPDTPLGALRAECGHPEPFGVRHWEIGNEIWGHWQVHWTTPRGNVDRYREFARAMLAADPDLTLYACGAPMTWDPEWNDVLVREAARDVRSVTVHPLVGGEVAASTDPLDVYRDFMAVPVWLERRYAALRDALASAGAGDPRLAITELQLFARIARPEGDASDDEPRLTRSEFVTPATLAEAVYDTLIYHAAVRLAPFVELVTHSATVNHGGGLRKERERVYANPCHYAQSAFAAFAGATPVAAELECAFERPPVVIGDLKRCLARDGMTADDAAFGVVDALAAVAPDGALLMSLVNRGSAGDVTVAVEIEGLDAGASAELRLIAGEEPWSANSLDTPDCVAPVDSDLSVRDGRLEIALPRSSVASVRIAARA